MTYQPKSAGKMADFKTLTLSISLNSSQMCTYFRKDVVTDYCLCLIKNPNPDPHSFSKLILLPKPCCYGLESHMKFVYILR